VADARPASVTPPPKQNSPLSRKQQPREHHPIRTRLSEWMGDGPLAVFFCIDSIELRNELTVGYPFAR
jgi:hypothetical protein